MPNPWGQPTFEDKDRQRRQQQLEQERDNYQRQIQRENIKNLRLQNSALGSSIRAMGGSTPGQSTGRSITTYTNRNTGQTTRSLQEAIQWAGPPSPGQSGGAGASAATPAQSQNNFPSLAEIRAMITSSQAKAQEDFDGKINLLQNQERQKQEEEQVTARNAASRTLSYQQRSAAGAWESALRGR